MKIKICGITDASALDAALSAGADALGFVFAKSPREISPTRARELSQLVPTGVARVAVTRHPSLQRLKEILEVFDPDCLQSDAEDFEDLVVRRGPHLIPVFRQGMSQPGAFGSNQERDSEDFRPDFLYEGAQSGQGQTVDWSRAAAFAGRGRMMLAGGLNPDNVAEAITTSRAWGVDVSSGVELAPGKKDPKLIRAFVSAARQAANKMNEERNT